jgi:hypothetical protein
MAPKPAPIPSCTVLDGLSLALIGNAPGEDAFSAAGWFVADEFQEEWDLFKLALRAERLLVDAGGEGRAVFKEQHRNVFLM